ncbi:hypothetical protein BDC45DRAFT_604724 [Circinella umbellata]|nr:hypothetical protein BDC45DRAFT_604724 [Circinella umbellata]
MTNGQQRQESNAGTCESRHAISTEEWEHRKPKIVTIKKQQQQQDATKQLKQIQKLDQQTHRQHQQQHHQHFLTYSIVALLIYSSYEKELRELLNHAKLLPKDNFDPMMLLAKLSKNECITEAKKIYQDRILAMCSHMPKKHLGLTILHHFTLLPKDDLHYIDSEYRAKFQEKNPKPLPHQYHLLNSLDDA